MSNAVASIISICGLTWIVWRFADDVLERFIERDKARRAAMSEGGEQA